MWNTSDVFVCVCVFCCCATAAAAALVGIDCARSLIFDVTSFVCSPALRFALYGKSIIASVSWDPLRGKHETLTMSDGFGLSCMACIHGVSRARDALGGMVLAGAR